MAHAIAPSQHIGLSTTLDGIRPARLDRLVRRLLACEADAEVRCAWVAGQDADPMRALAMRRVTSHAERTLWTLPIAMRDEGLLSAPGAIESAWRTISEHFAGLLGVGQGYRRAVHALERGLDLMREIMETAVTEDRLEVCAFAARWLDERAPLVTDARAALETHTLA